VIVFYAIFKSSKNDTPTYGIESLAYNPSPSGRVSGKSALGILLQVSPMASRSGYGLVRTETRSMRVDVEVPGEMPYVVDAMVQYPSNLARDIVPGATVELRVSSASRQQIEIVGPGVGFSSAAFFTGPGGVPPSSTGTS
jgi:hypothetical protein